MTSVWMVGGKPYSTRELAYKVRNSLEIKEDPEELLIDEVPTRKFKFYLGSTGVPFTVEFVKVPILGVSNENMIEEGKRFASYIKNNLAYLQHDGLLEGLQK